MVSFSGADMNQLDCTALANILALGTYPAGIENLTDLACVFGLNKGREFTAAQSIIPMPKMETSEPVFFQLGDQTNQCQWIFKTFVAPTIEKRVCGNNTATFNPIEATHRYLSGGIYQSNSSVSEYCCHPSTISNFNELMAFMAFIYDSMKVFIEDFLRRAIYAPVGTCVQGDRKAKTVLDEATENNGLIDLTAVKPLTLGALLSRIENKTRNLGQYVLFLPNTVFDYLNSKQIDIQQPFAIRDCTCDEARRMLNLPGDCALPTLRKMSSMDVIVISIPDSYVQKSGANWVAPLINVNSLAAEIFAPRDSFFQNNSSVIDLLSQFVNTSGMPIRMFAEGPSSAFNYNSMITTMFGFVGGRISQSKTYAVILAPDPAATK